MQEAAASSPATRQRLSDAAHRFCSDFARKASLDALTHFSTTHPCEVFEHGLPTLAPFLGRSFRGLDGVRDYLSTLAALISYQDMHFSEYVIDAEARKVSVKGTATFTWIATCQSWDETFAYVLNFDDQDKIIRYQIWGDTGSLYLAIQGRLSQVGNSVLATLAQFTSTLARTHERAQHKSSLGGLPIQRECVHEDEDDE